MTTFLVLPVPILERLEMFFKRVLHPFFLHYVMDVSDIDFVFVERVILSIFVAVGTLSWYYALFGRRHLKKRKSLEKALAEAEAMVEDLEEKLAEAEAEEDIDEENESLLSLGQRKKKQIRVFMDGAFDVMHYGHMNAFRQGRSKGNYLVVGVNSDESIAACKGTPPIMNDIERIAQVKACKWVDEVVENVPYVMTPDYLKRVIAKYSIDYVVHGDDPCIVDGKDVYAEPKAMGIYRSIPRTEGVSTTDIVGRMLVVHSKDHHDRAPDQSPMGGSLMSRAKKQKKIFGSTRGKSKFLTTSRMIRIFSQGKSREIQDADRVVYVDGAFDMFHSGHAQLLMEAKKLGTYLIVGIHNDQVVNRARGGNYPILSLNERILSVLGCRYVDDVLFDAPWEITEEMVASLGIDVVAGGIVSDCSSPALEESEYYKIPKKLGIFKFIESKSDLTVDKIVERILKKEGIYKQKVEKKMVAENAYYEERYGKHLSDLNPVKEEDGFVPPLKLS